VQAMWQAVLDGPLRGKPVKRVVATHHHPDHIGFHGWFVEEFGAEYVSTQVAYLTGRMLTLDAQERYTPGQIDFYRRAGMRSDLLATRQVNGHSIFLTWCILFPLALPALKRVT